VSRPKEESRKSRSWRPSGAVEVEVAVGEAFADVHRAVGVGVGADGVQVHVAGHPSELLIPDAAGD
jgi:hypothetical protein